MQRVRLNFATFKSVINTIKILLNHGFPRPKISLGTLGKVRIYFITKMLLKKKKIKFCFIIDKFFYTDVVVNLNNIYLNPIPAGGGVNLTPPLVVFFT